MCMIHLKRCDIKGSDKKIRDQPADSESSSCQLHVIAPIPWNLVILMMPVSQNENKKSDTKSMVLGKKLMP